MRYFGMDRQEKKHIINTHYYMPARFMRLPLKQKKNWEKVRFCGAEADTQAARIIRQTGLAILPQQKIIWQQY